MHKNVVDFIICPFYNVFINIGNKLPIYRFIMTTKVSKRQLERYPKYLIYLKQLENEGVGRVSSKVIASVFDCSEEQVRKDFQAISKVKGKPRNGRSVKEMIETIEEFLGYSSNKDAIIIGVGRLGGALLNYDGFKNYGLNIIAGFDKDQSKAGYEINGKKIYHMDDLERIIQETNVKIAIITSGKDSAQEVTNKLVKYGIKGIWNFARKRIDVPEDVAVETVDLPASLAILTYKLASKGEGKDE